MARYFYSLGHRKVLFISDNNVCMDSERYQGFKAGMKEEKVDFMMIPIEKGDRRKYYINNLSRLKEYTAIFLASDYYAIDLMQFLQENGVRIPEDISVAGFDDSPVCEMVYPSLTTIHQDEEEMARKAIEMIKELNIKNAQGFTLKLPVKLVKRDSVK